jgi:hypothetical protein
VSFPTTHRREPSSPIKGTLALPLPGCQTRLRVIPDVGRDRIIPVRRGNHNLCHSKISENDPSLKALAEAMARAEQAKAEGRPWRRRFETSQGPVYLD